MPFVKSKIIFLTLTISGLILLFLFYHRVSRSNSYFPLPFTKPPPVAQPPVSSDENVHYFWAQVPQRYPAKEIRHLPQSVPKSIPTIQHSFSSSHESKEARKVRTARLEAVKGNFTHAWQGYKTHAWGSDEVAPLSGAAQNPFGGWAATLVDALDSLWIMGLYSEFEDAVRLVEKLDFTSCSLEELNVFETTIRYLGGLLAAYDVSGGKYPILLRKAIEIGQMLYVAFDTPNRMPITRWKFHDAILGVPQETSEGVLVAEIGSLTLEFTRLSQLTKDDRYFDAVQRIMDEFDAQQNQTKLPGMWPVIVNAKSMNFHDYSGFTIGGMADSLYEYLPKQHILLGGGSQQYQKLYQDALVPMKQHIFFRPMAPDADVLLPGDVSSDGQTPLSELKTEGKAQHLSCFAGGMVALGAKVFNVPEDLDVARKLVDGCLWGYEINKLGIMPEIMRTVVCEDSHNCIWDEGRWHREVDQAFPDDNGSAEEKIKTRRLPSGITKIDDGRYILRPEAIESVFIFYRITGDPTLVEKAWSMFETIVKYTITDIAHAGLNDCTVDNPQKQDRMESFWLAETLKYFYLIFSDPHVVSLDEYVLNTEAHPLKRSA